VILVRRTRAQDRHVSEHVEDVERRPLDRARSPRLPRMMFYVPDRVFAKHQFSLGSLCGSRDESFSTLIPNLDASQRSSCVLGRLDLSARSVELARLPSQRCDHIQHLSEHADARRLQPGPGQHTSGGILVFHVYGNLPMACGGHASVDIATLAGCPSWGPWAANANAQAARRDNARHSAVTLLRCRAIILLPTQGRGVLGASWARRRVWGCKRLQGSPHCCHRATRPAGPGALGQREISAISQQHVVEPSKHRGHAHAGI
jgi:hypothetical protein